MSYLIFISETAEKQLYALEQKKQKRIKIGVKELEKDPFNKRSKADIKKLHGFFRPNRFRLLIGDFRIIYSVIGKEIKITEVFNRELGYGHIKILF
ncbi:MAG: type II toxin-antitoxin system RelE/ParE family toxin [Candidatus Micrarchaeia archaeon]|jgi:mRNA-degrading endonuclease RelE of RelBE toxin-antitoxin system